MQTLITQSRHPYYLIEDYQKFRLTYKGGREFIHRYLEHFEARETKEEFKRRRNIAHNPAFAAQALDEILGGITQRLPEITRKGVSESYNRAISGFDGGVNLQNSTMNSFIMTEVLPEMTSMGRVGVYVDMPQFNPFSTLADFARVPHPYLYPFNAFDILNWRTCYDQNRNELLLQSVLLRERHWVLNDAGLPYEEKEIFRLCQLQKDGVLVTFFQHAIDDAGKLSEQMMNQMLLPLSRIPFVMFDLGKSLLTDAADFQIGLLNLASADLSYAINANFPFYVEGYDPKTENVHAKTNSFDANGNPIESEAENTVVVGPVHGRRFPFEAPTPAFIHPSSEPLSISMAKQEAMKQDIRRLLNLNVSNVAPSRASAESKKIDQSSGLESGLSYIGLELEGGEREIALIWGEYEKLDVSDTVALAYPTSYSLKTDDQRVTEAQNLQKLQGAAPSRTFQKEIAKSIVCSVLEGKANTTLISQINSEIDAADYITGDPAAIQADFDMGLVDAKTAATARGYDPAKVAVAQAERVQRMKDIAMAQTKGSGAALNAARGGPGAPDANIEKQNVHNPDMKG